MLFFIIHHFGYAQEGKVIHRNAIQFSIFDQKDKIDFVVVDTILNVKKPLFLCCQGSLPVPLFCEIEGYGYYFFGGGISNFDYKKIVQDYHLVVISMPHTPVSASKENLNNQYQYIPDSKFPNQFSEEYLKSDYLDNYVRRANAVIKYLNKKSWVSNNKLIAAGHSQGSKVATKLTTINKKVSHLGVFSPNPFGRIDQFIRTARLNAHLNHTTWEEANSIINDNYAYFKIASNQDSINSNVYYKSITFFSEPIYDDWLSLKIPIYLAYGTEDRTSDLCDLMPIFFIQNKKDNLTMKRYLKQDHNFFDIKEGKPDYINGHWPEVMNQFLDWIKSK